MMVKKVTVVDYEAKQTHREMTFTCDAELQTLTKGLIEISNGEAGNDNPPILSLHLLKNGATYERLFEVEESFKRWMHAEAKIIENEVCLAVKRDLDPRGEFKNLPSELCKNGKAINEWDGILFDPTNKRLVVIETKHKFTLNHILNTCRRFNELRKMLVEATNHDSKPYLDLPKTLILAGAIFEHTAAVKGVTLLKEAYENKSRKNQIHLCRPNGTRFSLLRGEDFDPKKLKDEGLATRFFTTSQF
jgi:hypothetical protein